MLKCWKSNPKKRPTIVQVRKMLDDNLDTGGYTYLIDDTTAPLEAQKMDSFHSFKRRSSLPNKGHHNAKFALQRSSTQNFSKKVWSHFCLLLLYYLEQ